MRATERRLLILTPGELTRDPRAVRAAGAAVAAGFDVQGLCVSNEVGTVATVPVRRLPTPALEQALRGAGLGGMDACSRATRELRGLYRLGRHVRTTIRLGVAGRKLGRFAVVHANDFDTLPAAAYLARRSQARLVYDAHEIYTLQEPDAPRFYSAIVKRLEAALARRSVAVVTVSDDIADDLASLLSLERRPLAVLNCPLLDAYEPPQATTSGPLRVIYQGAMGPGRALADILSAAHYAEGAVITIRVIGADINAYRQLVSEQGLDHRVEVVEPVPPSELVTALHGFEVGLIINRPVTRNDELVLPNKLFEYLMGGLAVVAPDLPTLGSLIMRERVGITFLPGDPAAMGNALSQLASDRAELADMRARARAAAVARFNAQAQEETLALAWGLR